MYRTLGGRYSGNYKVMAITIMSRYSAATFSVAMATYLPSYVALLPVIQAKRALERLQTFIRRILFACCYDVSGSVDCKCV